MSALCFDWLRWFPLWLVKAVSWFVERKSTGFEKYSRPKKKKGKELDITVPSRWSHFINGFPVVFLSVSWSSSCWACLRSNTVNTPSCHSLNKITALPLKSVLLNLYPTTLYGTNPTINLKFNQQETSEWSTASDFHCQWWILALFTKSLQV